MRRLTVALVFIVLFTAAFSQLYRIYAKKFYDLTGSAQWIWAPHRISRNQPVVFFAARDFTLPAHRRYTQIKVLGDPEYVLYFNGKEIGGRSVRGDLHLDFFDVSASARTGRNRILVAARSVSGVGGLIASVDISPGLEAFVVTDPQWKIFRRWNDQLPMVDAPEGALAPMIVGDPPTGRWNFLPVKPGPAAPPVERVLQPKAEFAFIANVPVIRTRSGVDVTVTEKRRAVAYDFGPTSGRVRLRLVGTQAVPPVVNVRQANSREELTIVESTPRPFVFGEGEKFVTDPEVNYFRYVVVYGGRARAEVVQ